MASSASPMGSAVATGMPARPIPAAASSAISDLIIVVNGVEVTCHAYGRRREILDGLMVVETSPTMTVPRHWVDVSPADMLEVCA
jgi:hypothetical protein